MRWTIWLAHHPPEEAERCTSIAGVALCRRCLGCWPVAFATLVTSVVAALPQASVPDLVVLWTPPLLEYVAEHALGRRYSARRTWLASLLLGLALGRTFHRYVLDPTDVVAWAALGLAAGVGGLSAVIYHSSVKNRASV